MHLRQPFFLDKIRKVMYNNHMLDFDAKETLYVC